MKSRTPKNYSGVENPAKKLSEMLPKFKDEISKKAKLPNEVVFALWFELIGEKMGPLTEPVSFVDEVLTVKVKSSTLYSLLVTHERPRLLKKLQKKISIRNIFFRIG